MLVWRSVASNALNVLIVLLVGVALAIGIAHNRYAAPGPLAEPMCFSVPRGATFLEVSQALADRGAVTTPILFRLGAEYSGRADALKAGNFLIPDNSSMAEIVDLVTASGASTCGSDINLRIGVASAEVVVRDLDPASGDYAVVAEVGLDARIPETVSELLRSGFPRLRVTLAEGVTSWQVADSLSRTWFLSGDVAETPDEGTLAPGSYEVTEGETRAEVLRRMREAQEVTLAAAWAGRAEDLPLANAYEALILASIIEKETALPEERPLVASVFVNRLRAGMRLQTDPTVIYGITGGQGTLGRGLLRSELDRATPYNTYVIEGLPPTPIANPGAASIKAAVNPEASDFLFFVADGTGGHAFARTLEEHNANVRRWREIEARQSQ